MSLSEDQRCELDSAAAEVPATPTPPRRGRGAVGNPPNRYDSERLEDFDDGWGDEDGPAALPTVVTSERVRTIVTSNQSPDIPFDRSINPYKGCEHGCIYCFARPSHAYLGLSPGLDFETRLFAKHNAATVLRATLRRKGYQPEVLALGANTDPYQPIEKKLRITRQLLEVLRDHKHPVVVVTKSQRVTADLDILAELARENLVRVYFSITTLDRGLARVMEPRAALPQRRLAAMRTLVEAGVPCGVMASPMIPGLNDADLEGILEAAADAGADCAGYLLVRLPLELKELFEQWLDVHYPDRKSKVLRLIRSTRGGKLYESGWGTRMRGRGPYADFLKQRFQIAVRRFGLATNGSSLALDRFTLPPQRGDQLGLL